MRRAWLLIIALCVFASVGCSVNPVTGEQNFTLISTSEEIALGEKNYAPYQQQQGGRYTVDPELSLYVSQVGQKVAKASDVPNLPYEFVVLNNDVPNAWALPGGKIAVNRGLLTEIDDEAQLAAVLGHEVTHAAARHSAQQMSQQMVLGVGLMVAGVASSDSKYGSVAMVGGSIGAGLWQAKYSRDNELEADNYGIDYMVRAGYEPYAAVELQETFVEMSKERGKANWFSSLFSSHPPSQERVDRNKAKVAKFPPGKRNKAAYQQAIAQLNKDAEAYKAHRDGVKAANDKELGKSLKLVNKAIALQPQEGIFYISKGQILRLQKDNAGAAKAFEKAVAKNPDYFLGYLELGLVQKELGKNSDAKSNLEKSQKLLPTDVASKALNNL